MAYGPLLLSLFACAVIGLFGRNEEPVGATFDIVASWLLALACVGWYIAVFVIYATEAVKGKLPRRRRVSIWAAVFMFITYPFATSLLIYAVYESDPTSFSNVTEPSLAAVRITRFWAVASLTQSGTGFTLVAPVVWYSELLMSVIAKLYALVNFLVITVFINNALDRN